MDFDTAKNKYSKPALKSLVIIIYFLCLLIIALFAYRRPIYNWDMLAYMALVVQEDHKDINQIHDLTFQAAKDNIPSLDYEHLVGGEYRRNLSENSETFYQTLPFYAIKPLYVKLVSLFHKDGFSLPRATVLPSIICYMLIGLLLFYWLEKYLNLIWAFAASLSIMFSGFMVFLARDSTPDCLSAFLLISSFYFIIERPSLKWILFFLALSVFARIDNIVACFFILSFLFITNKWQGKINLSHFLLMLVLMTACYFGITTIAMKPFGWNVFYYPTFARQLDLSHVFHSTFSFKAYFDLVISQLATAVVFYHFIFFFLFIFLILYSPTCKYKNVTFDQTFCFLLLVIMLFRFALYPDFSDRFNIAYYLCFLIIFIKRYTSFFQT